MATRQRPDGYPPRRPLVAQLADYGLAALLALSGLHTSGPMRAVVLGGAAALAALGALAKGPLAAFPRLGARAHRAVSLLVAALLIGSPAVVRHHLDVVGVVVTELVGVALAWLTLSRRAAPRPTPVVDAPAAAAPARPAGARPVGPRSGYARSLGRIAGILVRSARSAR